MTSFFLPSFACLYRSFGRRGCMRSLPQVSYLHSSRSSPWWCTRVTLRPRSSTLPSLAAAELNIHPRAQSTLRPRDRTSLQVGFGCTLSEIVARHFSTFHRSSLTPIHPCFLSMAAVASFRDELNQTGWGVLDIVGSASAHDATQVNPCLPLCATHFLFESARQHHVSPPHAYLRHLRLVLRKDTLQRRTSTRTTWVLGSFEFLCFVRCVGGRVFTRTPRVFRSSLVTGTLHRSTICKA